MSFMFASLILNSPMYVAHRMSLCHSWGTLIFSWAAGNLPVFPQWKTLHLLFLKTNPLFASEVDIFSVFQSFLFYKHSWKDIPEQNLKYLFSEDIQKRERYGEFSLISY